VGSWAAVAATMSAGSRKVPLSRLAGGQGFLDLGGQLHQMLRQPVGHVSLGLVRSQVADESGFSSILPELAKEAK
jgi:hypothetical protein